MSRKSWLIYVLFLAIFLFLASGCTMQEFRAGARKHSDFADKLDRLTGPDISSRQMLAQHCASGRAQYRCMRALP